MSTIVASPPAETERVLREEHLLPSQSGEPAWEIARLFPLQGEWTEEDYLALEPCRGIELNEGVLEFLGVPTFSHHELLQFLYKRLDAFVRPRRLGRVYVNGVKVRLWPGKIREPDVVYLVPERMPDWDRPSQGADLTMEIVSPAASDRRRDVFTKRREYAKAGIPEYWIVDAENETITVLMLVDAEYQVHGEFKPGQVATSVALPGFEIDVTDCFNAGRGEFLDD